MDFITSYSKELIATGITLLLLVILRFFFAKLVRKYAKTNHTFEQRTNLVIKYIHLLINILSVIALIIIWGVRPKDIVLAVSSIATVVGVAMIAQWSIVSNITAGVILFFSFPFKIGDTIKIHDKDFPISGEIEDITAFHIILKSADGERVAYPNNLLFQKGISILQNELEEKEFTD